MEKERINEGKKGQKTAKEKVELKVDFSFLHLLSQLALETLWL